MGKSKRRRRRLGCWAGFLLAGPLLCAGLVVLGDRLPKSAAVPTLAVLADTAGRVPTETPTLLAASATVTASATITETATATVTASATITETARPSATAMTWQEAGRIRGEQISRDWQAVDGVESVGTVVVIYNTVYGELKVRPGSNNEALAEALQQVAFEVMVDAGIEFSVILDDGRTAISYTWLNRSDEWNATRLTVTGLPPATAIPTTQLRSAAPQSPFGCNGIDDLNCSDFRAIGQSANAHLAQCGDEDNLDREGDGQACEQ